jgi:phenylacetate-CoA ligase
MISKIYAYSPVFLQNIWVSAYGYYWKTRRYGGDFLEKVNEFKDREEWNAQQWDNYQLTQLRKLLTHAFVQVPLYRRKYEQAGFTKADFVHFERGWLQNLPVLEKEELRQYGTSLLLAKNRAKGKFYQSSGSTGTPTQIYMSTSFHRLWSALYETRVRHWAKVDYKVPRAMIGGRRVLPSAKSKPPYYRYNYAEKQAYFSAYHLSEKTIADYNKGLIEAQSAYLVGYAMSIYLWATLVNKLDLKAPKMRAVLTSSETLTQHMRQTIESVFDCKVFDAYSGVEACGLISENEFGELLFSPDSGIMEVLTTDGQYAKPGETGELISTGLLNFDQPLIRYRIGDVLTLASNQKSKSGLNMPVISHIEGRTEDVIVGQHGQQMVRFHSIFNGINGLVMAQVIQHTLTHVEIKLVTDKHYRKDAEYEMATRIHSQLGTVEITFNYVPNIDKTKNGKYKAVVSKL